MWSSGDGLLAGLRVMWSSGGGLLAGLRVMWSSGGGLLAGSEPCGVVVMVCWLD